MYHLVLEHKHSLFNQCFEKLQYLSSLPQLHVTSHLLIYEVEDLPWSWDLSLLLFSHQFLYNHCSMSDFPVLHYLLRFTQAQVHWFGDAIQPSHPLLPPSPSAFNFSQHQVFFFFFFSQWVSYSHQVAKVLEIQLQHQSFQGTFRTDFL